MKNLRNIYKFYRDMGIGAKDSIWLARYCIRRGFSSGVYLFGLMTLINKPIGKDVIEAIGIV